MTDYTVRLEKVFQGPLDLLLHLVREQEVEIHEVEISKVIDGYLAYLEALRELDIEVAGEFLVLASTLMAIKSRSLLPAEDVDLEDELDPRDELIQRLLEYRRFKEVSDGLATRQYERSQLHERGHFTEMREEDEDELLLDLGELTAWDLLGTFSRLMRETMANQPHHVAGEARPMRYYVRELAHKMREVGSMSLRSILTAFGERPDKQTLVGTFCALLELVKLGVVTAEQVTRKEEIHILLRPEAAEGVDDLLDATNFEDELTAALPEEDAPDGAGETPESVEGPPEEAPEPGLEATAVPPREEPA